MKEQVKRSPRAKMVYFEELGALVQEDLLPDMLFHREMLPDVDNTLTGAELRPGQPEICQGLLVRPERD